MLRITIELLPLGEEEKKSHLGTVEIWNDATGGKTSGNYRFRLSRKGRPTSTWKTGEVKAFPRQRLSAYDLLLRVLTAALGDRNTPKPKRAVASQATKTRLVKITKARSPTYWYADYVGQVFEVVDHPATGSFAVEADYNSSEKGITMCLITKDDCEVVEAKQ